MCGWLQEADYEEGRDRRMKPALTDEQKQKNFFKSIYQLCDKVKKVTPINGEAYKQIILYLSNESLEEIKKWSGIED